MARSTRATRLHVGGHRIELTNLDKVLYPEAGTRKRDVIDYYRAVAAVLLAHLADRPVTRKRWVDGVGTSRRPGESFFHKDLPESTPSWVKRASLRHKTHTNRYPRVNDEATLVWLAQSAALELHVPQWRFGAHGRRRNPDRLVLDLDPGEGAGIVECAAVARWARALLGEAGLAAVPVTSGGSGLHVYAALDGSRSGDEAAGLAHELARALESDHGDLVVSTMAKDRRAGRVFVDWSQNNRAKTTVSPYSLRGRFRPTVAAPRTWAELASPDLEQLEYGEVLDRVRRRGDLLAPLLDAGAPATEGGDDDRSH